MRSWLAWKQGEMRLSDLLSRAPDPAPLQVEGFLDDRRLNWGKHKKIKVGRVFHNFHCKQCDDQRTFESGDELYCLGIGDQAVSIDVTLQCTACRASVEVWFLLRSDGEIFERAPTVQIERYTENLRDRADRAGATPLAKVKIPVPPLDVQREIVRILDEFSALETKLAKELDAELEARRRQYAFYPHVSLLTSKTNGSRSHVLVSGPVVSPRLRPFHATGHQVRFRGSLLWT